MEEKIIKILELVQTKDDGTVEFSEESKKLIHEVAEKCRILPIYQQNKEKVNTYKDGMTAKQVYIDMCFKIVNAPTQIHMMMTPTGTIVDGILAQATSNERELTKHLWDQKLHSLTHTLVVSGRCDLKKSDILAYEEKAYLVLAVDNAGDLGFAGIAYLEERNDLK